MSVFGRLVWGERAVSAAQFELDVSPGTVGDPFRGLNPTERALRLAYSYAAVRIRADWLAAAPLHFYERSDGKTRVDPPAWAEDPYPAWSMTPEMWKFQAASSLAMNGNLYGLTMAVDDMGLPSMVRWVSPLAMRCDVDRNDQLSYVFDNRPMPTTRVQHARGFTLPGNPCGISPVDQFRHVVDLGLSAEEFTAAWFRNGSHPTTHLSAKGPLDKAEALLYKERWLEATKGERGVVVTGNDVTRTSIQDSPKDSNAIEVAWQAGREAALVWGVPPWLLGVPQESGMTYANVDQIWTQFQVGTLRFDAIRLEQLFNRWVRPSIFCKFNTL